MFALVHNIELKGVFPTEVAAISFGSTLPRAEGDVVAVQEWFGSTLVKGRVLDQEDLERMRVRRERECKGKSRFGNELTAKGAAADGLRLRKVKLRVYLCPHCDGYHLTSREGWK